MLVKCLFICIFFKVTSGSISVDKFGEILFGKPHSLCNSPYSNGAMCQGWHVITNYQFEF